MMQREIKLVSRENGERVLGQQYGCDVCQGETFLVYVVTTGEEAGHLHLQCATCDMTFCRHQEKGPTP